jgi:hypothetical protein
MTIQQTALRTADDAPGGCVAAPIGAIPADTQSQRNG